MASPVSLDDVVAAHAARSEPRLRRLQRALFSPAGEIVPPGSLDAETRASWAPGRTVGPVSEGPFPSAVDPSIDLWIVADLSPAANLGLATAELSSILTVTISAHEAAGKARRTPDEQDARGLASAAAGSAWARRLYDEGIRTGSAGGWTRYLRVFLSPAGRAVSAPPTWAGGELTPVRPDSFGR